MKKFFVIALLLLFSKSIFSQDLIVTVDGDSLNCKITKVKADEIDIIFKDKDGIKITSLTRANVKTYKYKYFETSELPDGKVKGRGDYQRLRFAVNGGYSYHLGSVPEGISSDLREYIFDLKSGYHYGCDLTYNFNERYGAGINYKKFSSSNSVDIYVEDINGNRRYGKMSDDLTISFFGPAFTVRQVSKNMRNTFYSILSVGYMSYSDNKVIIDNYKMTGNTAGASVDIGYEFGLSKNLSLGLQISLIRGTLVRYDWSDGINTYPVKLDEDEYESLDRIDFSVGLRFGK
jgi:hypothetical protein